MSTVPRVPAADLPEAFMLQPDLFAAFWDLYGTLWMDGLVDHRTKEVARLRNARVTGCGYCRNVRFSLAREQGLDEETASLIDDGYESSPLPDREVALLAWVDRFLQDPGPPPPDVAGGFAHHFNPAEQAELGLAVGMFVGFAKMLITLGLEPVDMPVTVVPTPGSHRPAAQPST